MPTREPPIHVPAPSPPKDAAHGATIIFMHGFSDDAAGVENIAQQFHSAGKLTHLSWIFPNAPPNMDARATAWYLPTGLPAVPSQRPELDDPEDEDGMRVSMRYVESLIDETVAKGVPADRIIVGGFSQGCAMSLFTTLLSEKYADRLAGVCGLAGYLPVAGDMAKLRKEVDLPVPVPKWPLFYERGKADMLVPKRYFNITVDTLKELRGGEEGMETKEYDGVGHVISPKVLGDMCAWLEKIVPSLE